MLAEDPQAAAPWPFALNAIHVGEGFNLIARPDFREAPALYLQVNQTRETLTITPIGSAIPNRRFGQNDIELQGLTYLDTIHDAFTGGALHIEPGIWVTQPPTIYPPESPAPAKQIVARMAGRPSAGQCAGRWRRARLRRRSRTAARGLRAIGGLAGPRVAVGDLGMMALRSLSTCRGGIYERTRGRRGHGKAIVATARKLAVLFWCMLTRGEDYAHQKPLLTKKKLRALELTAGAQPRTKKAAGVWSTNRAIREAERELAEQAEASYKRMLKDWQAGSGKKVGASAATVANRGGRWWPRREFAGLACRYRPQGTVSATGGLGWLASSWPLIDCTVTDHSPGVSARPSVTWLAGTASRTSRTVKSPNGSCSVRKRSSDTWNTSAPSCASRCAGPSHGSC